MIVLVSGCLSISESVQPLNSNVVEFGCGYYGEDDFQSGVPELHPPELKLYSDGRLIVQEDEDVEVRHLGASDLARLRRRAEEVAGQASGELESGKCPLLMHGGLCYVVFGSGASEVMQLFDGLPGGRVGRLLERLKAEDRVAREAFVPEHVTVELEAASPASTDRPWPFSVDHDLTSIELGSMWRIEDRAILEYLFDDPVGTSWRFRDGGRSFRLRLRHVEDWYDPR